MKSKREIIEILDRLKQEYPHAECALMHRNVFELIVCVVLSAQTTDVSVNKISPQLFGEYPTPEALAAADLVKVEEIIRTIGMYRTKSRNIIKLAQGLCDNFGGKVPEDYDQLISLPGVGRKTANVVLAVGFGHERIAVDTHVFRVSRRIGLAGNACDSKGEEGGAKLYSAKSAGTAEVLATEEELMRNLPKDRWSEAHHSLIWHGRKCCTAKAPACDRCTIRDLCDFS